jgi:MinD-like ATPase involved in chromosome partitioning or flagellar assembly
MAADRYVVLGVAGVRSGWFSELSRWATSGAVPVEFVKAVSAEEVRARLRSGRQFSALLVGADVAGLDRDLIMAAHDNGATVIVVGPDPGNRDWTDIGAAAVLDRDLDRTALLGTLDAVAAPVARAVATDAIIPPAPVTGLRGRLVAVTGAGGTGASTLAIGLAQALADDPRYAHVVCLADLALRADQGALHDVDDVVPSVVELAEAHRSGRPSSEEVRRLTWQVTERGYHLLLGLRRSREWTAVRPRSFEAALDGLRHAFRVVVADIDADVDGEDETGSIDLEERNVMARTTALAADLVVVVGRPGVKGIHSLLRVIGDLVALGVAPDRLVPVINDAPRGARARAELTAAFGLLAADTAPAAPTPLFVARRKRVDESLHDGSRLPRQLGAGLFRAVSTLLARREAVPVPESPVPVPVVAGSLGSWTEGER